MPELPEVETTRRGLAPHLQGRRVHGVILRRADLRWPIPPEVAELLPGQRIEEIRRRAKYLLLDTAVGSAVLHLGMSGSLRVLPAIPAARPRPRRHQPGQRPPAALQRPAPLRQPALAAGRRSPPAAAGLGPEPLDDVFDGDYLFARSRGRSAPVKTFLMDQAVVVGVGNIYAAESLFKAGISLLREAGKISRERYQRLAGAVKEILGYAITRAAPRCAISSALTAHRATSSRNCWCTAATACHARTVAAR